MDKFLNQEDELSRLIEEQAKILYHKIDRLPIDKLDLAEFTRGYYEGRHNDRKFFSVQTAAELLYHAIRLKNKPVSENTCNPENGVGAEHIIPVTAYKKIIESKRYRLAVLPAFWDTHN